MREIRPPGSEGGGVELNRVQSVWLQGCDIHAASGIWVGVLLRI
jgi:hypothetical protein